MIAGSLRWGCCVRCKLQRSKRMRSPTTQPSARVNGWWLWHCWQKWKRQSETGRMLGTAITSTKVGWVDTQRRSCNFLKPYLSLKTCAPRNWVLDCLDCRTSLANIPILFDWIWQNHAKSLLLLSIPILLAAISCGGLNVQHCWWNPKSCSFKSHAGRGSHCCCLKSKVVLIKLREF